MFRIVAPARYFMGITVFPHMNRLSRAAKDRIIMMVQSMAVNDFIVVLLCV